MRAYPTFAISLGLALLVVASAPLAGCSNSRQREGASIPAAPAAEETPQPAATDAQQPKYAFSTTVDSDTKTEAFAVHDYGQVLHYNLIGGSEARAFISIHSHPDGALQAGASASEPGPHTKTLYLSPGTYYMEIRPESCSVEVKVED